MDTPRFLVELAILLVLIIIATILDDFYGMLKILLSASSPPNMNEGEKNNEL